MNFGRHPRSKGLLLAVLATASATAYGGAACLLFPLSCLVPSKKYGEEQDALVLDVSSHKTIYYERGAQGQVTYGSSTLNDSQVFYVTFKVGSTIYQAEHRNDNAFSVMFGYKVKRAEWVGKTLKMKLRDEKFVGIPMVGAIFKRPGDGKELRLSVTSIIGPDGVDECKMGGVCQPQIKVNRASREAEQLEKIRKSGGKSATDVAPAPVELPPEPASAPAEAGTAEKTAVQESPPPG